MDGTIIFSVGFLLGGFAVHFLYTVKAMQPQVEEDDIDSELSELCKDLDDDNTEACEDIEDKVA